MRPWYIYKWHYYFFRWNDRSWFIWIMSFVLFKVKPNYCDSKVGNPLVANKFVLPTALSDFFNNFLPLSRWLDLNWIFNVLYSCTFFPTRLFVTLYQTKWIKTTSPSMDVIELLSSKWLSDWRSAWIAIARVAIRN